MTIKKKADHWIVDVRPDGAKGKRIIRKFRTKAEATRFESFVIAETTAGRPWNPSKKEYTKLSELIAIWNNEHASTITSGNKYHKKLEAFCKHLGDPVATNITSQDISKWRSARLKQVKATTANIDLSTVKNLFNWLIKRGYFNNENPANAIDWIKTQEEERPYLEKDQIDTLWKALPLHHDRDVALISRICIETGCRWSEAQNLTRDRVKRDRLIFTNTKGKKKRAVPISAELAELIRLQPNSQLFRKCETTGREWLNNLLDLPKGISSHILRHTFASHFVMAGGNILTLQKILGHSKIEMTMRYAHLAPDHLEDTLSLNPIAQMERKWKAK